MLPIQRTITPAMALAKKSQPALRRLLVSSESLSRPSCNKIGELREIEMMKAGRTEVDPILRTGVRHS